MSFSGHMIYQTQDHLGEIRVLDQGDCYVLSFGPGDEQGAFSKKNASHMCFEYIKAMLTPLVWTNPKKVLCLGLGTGSLVSILHHQFKQSHIQAVELRQEVININTTYFQYPNSQRVSTVCMDAYDFMQANQAHYDLVFSDLYLENHMDTNQMDLQFLQACQSALKPRGTLIINCWKEHGQERRLLQALETQLNMCVFRISLPEGNEIFLARNDMLVTPQKSLEKKARVLGRQLGFDMSNWLKRMK